MATIVLIIVFLCRGYLFLEITAVDHCVRAGVRHRLFGVRQWTATSLPVGGAIRQSMATLAKP
jgi:hypothetical protein